MSELLAILLLQGGYNTTVVCLGAAALGAGGGVVGVFSLLRSRALISDAVSHATLPGVAGAFILGSLLLGEGRQLALLLAGAGISAVLGVLAVEWIVQHTRLGSDVAIGTVLSVFYGLGMVMLSVVQTLRTGGQAGLEDFLLGATAGMLRGEAELIAVAALLVTGLALLLFKEFGLVCFDPGYAAARGWPVAWLDLAMMGLLISIVVIGLKTVGLVLIIAIVIIPPAAARFWSERLGSMVAISALIGAVGCYLGAALSALAPDLPTGGLVVVTLAALFTISLLLAPARGLLAATARQLRFRWLVSQRQGLLRLALGQRPDSGIGWWSLRLRGWMDGQGTATPEGVEAARRVSRDQALWERYWLDHPEESLALGAWSMAPIDTVLPADLVESLAARVDGEPD